MLFSPSSIEAAKTRLTRAKPEVLIQITAEGKSLKTELVNTALAMGAVGARVASCDMLEGPPSADPSYVLEKTKSVLTFAVPLGTDWISDCFGKKTRDVID